MFLTSKLLPVRHAFSTRSGGVSEGHLSSLNLGRSVGDDPARVAENARRFAEATGATPGQLVSVNQVHGEAVIEALVAEPGPDLPQPLGDADALVTRARGVAVGVRTADCGPVLLFAPDVGAVAAVHAGWRGAALGIAGRAVRELHDRYGADPSRVLAVVGPCIRACCYVVSAEVAARFERFGPGLVHGTGPEPRLDIAEASRRALLEAGVAAAHIEVMPYCTHCRPDLFFSHRRDQGRSGRHLSFVVLE